MSKLFCIMGKSASGKDTIFKKLTQDKNLNLKRVVSYTTRPMREGEQEGVEYHFVTTKRLEELEKKGKVIERRDYSTVHGIWSYFTVDDGQVNFSLNQDNIIIGTLESYQKIRTYFGKANVIPLYIHVEDGLRLERALKRERQQEEPGYAEMCRRFLADAEDFSEEKMAACEIDRIYENIDIEQCLNDIRKDILKFRNA
ncbi:guanylate kinase [Frisingicoccus sp.]|uniref:guanylate kinase n=1 Tax=Frisingicoccus sp. TaxID=1918627 RepID=UPI002602C407|nr:guanylate kinase [Frisingicoccus sp.]MDD6231765.1 guanylate kinase [Frisingicoccus sp.]MDY4833694.1 guanylate kinase [Frisingicoccus sp.]MDY4923485.1 guanylate kinase [Frisingicoccus sp.]